MSPKASQSQFSKLIRSIYYLDNKNINMFGVDNKSIVANQGPEVSNSQTETCPTNPEGGGYIYIYIYGKYSMCKLSVQSNVAQLQHS